MASQSPMTTMKMMVYTGCRSPSSHHRRNVKRPCELYISDVGRHLDPLFRTACTRQRGDEVVYCAAATLNASMANAYTPRRFLVQMLNMASLLACFAGQPCAAGESVVLPSLETPRSIDPTTADQAISQFPDSAPFHSRHDNATSVIEPPYQLFAHRPPARGTQLILTSPTKVLHRPRAHQWAWQQCFDGQRLHAPPVSCAGSRSAVVRKVHCVDEAMGMEKRASSELVLHCGWDFARKEKPTNEKEEARSAPVCALFFLDRGFLREMPSTKQDRYETSHGGQQATALSPTTPQHAAVLPRSPPSRLSGMNATLDCQSDRRTPP
ncbi:hypothetical protein HPB51_001788 [Rhipicephalus microplus]|uniref:Uncharacterized protein n=1 Tax=Rhipicephalus microplus TaxID=6941 RepID=A0A9J6EWC1_RHIMP|nr:hypothetical protein HPB51_001788 [Rhipicephalus microplus]